MQLSRVAGARGFGLIEIMVAALLLTVGLLGLAQLQLTSLRGAHSAGLRLEAVDLAYQGLEELRQQAQGGAAGAVDLPHWKAALAGALPSGAGTIERDGDIVTITVRWGQIWDQGNHVAAGTVSLRTAL
jgi:type IV pilus assembly protein PilV